MGQISENFRNLIFAGGAASTANKALENQGAINSGIEGTTSTLKHILSRQDIANMAMRNSAEEVNFKKSQNEKSKSLFGQLKENFELSNKTKKELSELRR